MVGFLVTKKNSANYFIKPIIKVVKLVIVIMKVIVKFKVNFAMVKVAIRNRGQLMDCCKDLFFNRDHTNHYISHLIYMDQQYSRNDQELKIIGQDCYCSIRLV